MGVTTVPPSRGVPEQSGSLFPGILWQGLNTLSQLRVLALQAIHLRYHSLDLTKGAEAVSKVLQAFFGIGPTACLCCFGVGPPIFKLQIVMVLHHISFRIPLRLCVAKQPFLETK